jgi:HK97 family phage major capsid protein
MATAKELGVKITTERQEFAKWMNDHKAADGSYDLSGDNLAEFNKRNAAIAGMQLDFANQSEAEKAAEENERKLAPQGTIAANKGGTDIEHKEVTSGIETKAQLDAAFKSAFTKHQPVLDAIAKGGRGSVSFDLGTSLAGLMGLKTTLQTTVHAPQADRRGTFGSALYYGNAENLFPHGSTGSKSVDYFIQTTDTDWAAAVAQTSAATDSAFAWTLTTDPVETVQTWIPMSHESIADNVGLQSTVEGMLANRLQKKSNNLILAGDGNTPNPTGVFIRTGFQTQAKGSDPAFDAIHKAITKVEITGDAICDFVAIHPTDWQTLRLTRTSDGIYILGNPADSAPLNLWGLPVTKTAGIGSAGTAGVGASEWAEVVEREGLTVEISTEHSTYFTERLVAVMLYRRFAVADYRPSAFATVTGL